MSSRFETRLNDSKKFNPIYTPTKSNSNPKQSDTQNIESKNEESKVDSSKEIQNITKDTNNNNRYKKHIIGTGQIYKNKEIFIETPEKDVVLGIDNVERDIYVEDVQITNGIASLVVAMSETITYSTCNKKALEDMYDENEDTNQVLCIDGVVRSHTNIVPYNMVIEVPGARKGDRYIIEDISIEGLTSKYILQNGDIVKTNVNFDYCIIGLQESYVISVKIKVV